MERTKIKHLVLILARELAANVATPMLIVDPDSILVYFNEAAERLLGESFANTGEVPVGKWARRREMEHLDGSPLPQDETPLARVLTGRQPATDRFRFVAGDGVKRTVTVACYPLLAQSDDLAGAVAIFWEPGEGE